MLDRISMIFCSLLILVLALACSKPSNNSDSNPPMAQPTLHSQDSIANLPLTYATFLSQILQPRCLHCHNPQGTDSDAAQVLLFPYATLLKHKSWFPENIEQSKLIKMITRTDEYRMPPPEDGAPLSNEEIQFIRQWLLAGHPE